MTTTTHTPLPEHIGPALDTRVPGEPRRRRGIHRAWLVGAAVLMAAAAVVTLVVLTIGGHDDADPAPLTGAHTGLVEHGSIRAVEGSVEDAVDAPARTPDPESVEAAELGERQAHLDGQAATYGPRAPETAVNPNGPGALASEHAAEGAGG